MNNIPQTPPLRVYKASAGSGKTFTLAIEYIKLLIDNPESYRGILAVTFTNKATGEMKQRIISQLHGLANGYNDSKDYLEKIVQELNVDEQTVRLKASQALNSLVHSYSYFRVETIDKFFQRVLRNLARELDLNANLRIELKDKEMEGMAVDTMIDHLDNKNPLLQWIMDYIIGNIGEGKSWNIINSVKKFGENIFKDAYKTERQSLSEALGDPHFFQQFKDLMWQIQEESHATMKRHADAFFNATVGYDASHFAYNTSGVYNHFVKLREGTYQGGPPPKRVAEALEDANKWSAQKSPTRTAIVELARTQLISILQASEADRPRCFRNAQSAMLTRKHLDQLRLLNYIESTMRQLNAEANRFLLSDTQGMLNALIDDSDTPFIFEKIGATLQHIMIDEFQDTGTVQWENFKILLNNLMDQGFSNLIVGDVKQSIYRWRSGDWRLLNNIRDEFTSGRDMVDVKSLDTNYRSKRKVVEFNNHFFVAASQLEYQRLLQFVGSEAEELRQAYIDVVQNVPEEKDDSGYVHVEMMTSKTFKDTIMQRLADTIHDLLDHGVKQSDIAILARSNKEIEATADYFQKKDPEIHIISDEAFRLDSSLTVNTIITALRVLSNEDDVLSKCLLAKTYQNQVLGNDIADDKLLLTTNVKEHSTAFNEWLPDGFKHPSERTHLHSKPLVDLVESIYHFFHLERIEGQDSYICTFYDVLADYMKENTSDITRFLKTWEENLSKTNIHGDEVDGVRMVTIHKSKGLEYDNLIIPFCNWELENTRIDNILWCHSKEETYSKLPVLPIHYSQSMLNTVYEDDYKREHLQNSVDNLNLLYVAFTRAKSRLFVFGVTPSSKTDTQVPSNRSQLIHQCLPLLTKPIETTKPDGTKIYLEALDATLEKGDGGSLIFDYGQRYEPKHVKKEKDPSKNIFLQADIPEYFVMQSNASRATFRQSNNSRAFTTSDENTLMRSSYIERGTLLHNIFSRLKDIDDLERVLKQLEHDGVIYDEIDPDELRQLVHNALSNKKAREWFSPKWTLHNECPILFHDENGKLVDIRPDRVMSDGKRTIVVDYKFGKIWSENDKQVKKYMKQLQKMGHDNVEGYLWYVSLNKIVPVTPEEP